jgi:DNA-binding CsgD family transcriptional regulator
VSNLSPSEQKVASLVVAGFSNKEIGNKLLVTEKTVKFHLTNIYAKLGVKSRTQLIVGFLKGQRDDNEFFRLMISLLKGDINPQHSFLNHDGEK